MLLLHTTGVSRIGDVHRYTVTYTPSRDRVLPPPAALHLRIRNTASLPFRAAYLRGPYTLYVAVRRQEFRSWGDDTEDQVQKPEGEEEEEKHDQDPELFGGGGIPV